jgi:tetratricopeptide (TPR) repeat protein
MAMPTCSQLAETMERSRRNKTGKRTRPVIVTCQRSRRAIPLLAKDYDHALDRLQKTIDLDPSFWLSHLFISRVYTEKGMHSEALDYLEKGFAERDVRLVFLKVEPQWDQLRSEPRFIDLIKRMKID